MPTEKGAGLKKPFSAFGAKVLEGILKNSFKISEDFVLCRRLRKSFRYPVA